MKVTISVGGRFHALQLAQELERRGHLHRFITTYTDGRYRRLAQEKLALVRWPDYLGRVWAKLPGAEGLAPWNYVKDGLFDLEARRRLDRCDIFHGWANYSLHSMRKAHRLGAKTVLECSSTHVLRQGELLREEYKIHGLPPPAGLSALLRNRLLKEYDLTDFICVPSHFVHGSFVEKGIDPAKLLLVPFGVDPGNFPRLPRTRDVFRVVFVGNIGLQKGIPYLLEAARRLDSTGLQVQIIGNVEPGMGFLVRELPANVTLVGHVPHLELHRRLSAASAFVLPSIEEGLSLTILEAMACGLPVIITPNTGGTTVVTDGEEGFVVPIRDADAIAQKIAYLYEHEAERRRMAEAAEARARQFSWRLYGEHMVACYRRVLAS